MTHSLEVAQIAKSIAIRLNHTAPFLLENKFQIEADICELAGLAHDMGHPPFGHNGEIALDRYMAASGGFEANAQTLRILTHLEKKERDAAGGQTGIGADGQDMRLGLNLTYRSLAAVLKYDQKIPESRKNPENPLKGYYECEAELVRKIKAHVVGNEDLTGFKTVECSIMDVADDIAFSTYDLEDALRQCQEINERITSVSAWGGSYSSSLHGNDGAQG